MKNILKKSIIRKIIYRKRKIFGCAYLIIHGSKHKNEDKEQKIIRGKEKRIKFVNEDNRKRKPNRLYFTNARTINISLVVHKKTQKRDCSVQRKKETIEKKEI